MAILNNPKIHYFLAGNGPLREELEALSEKLGIKNNVHFLGYRRDIPSLLKNADVIERVVAGEAGAIEEF